MTRGPFAVEFLALAVEETAARFLSRLPLGLTGDHDIRFEPLADGQTLLTFG